MSQNLHFYIQNIINPNVSIKFGFQNVLEMIQLGLKNEKLEEEEELLSLCFTYLEDLDNSLPPISSYETEIEEFLEGEKFLLLDCYYLVNKELWKNIKKIILTKSDKDTQKNKEEMNNLTKSITALESYQKKNILVVQTI